MLPMVELTIFALGILLIDLMLTRERKWLNPVAAFMGVLLAHLLCVANSGNHAARQHRLL